MSFVLFGATGDLAKRKIFPALYNLFLDQKIPHSFIKESGLGYTKGWKRLIIEKPFGHDLKSARDLNLKLGQAFEEEEMYRIDHYLGKPMVQNLKALGFANPVLQALWNNEHIANVQITASETIGVEERTGYYNHAGAIRDMVQKHTLQMLMMTAMHVPKRINAKEFTP